MASEFYEAMPVSLYLRDISLIEKIDGALQEVACYKHPELGNVLIIDGEIQHISAWQHYYHESIIHIPAAFIRTPETALILGGGDLYAAHEVLKYPTIKKVHICDWDANVIQLMQKYYMHGDAVVTNKKVQITYCDAKEFISTCTEKYDLVINDCFNLIDAFPNENVFQRLCSLLSDRGVCCDLIYRHIFERSCMSKTIERLQCVENKAFSLVTVPEYPGILHLLAIWGNGNHVSQNLNAPINEFQNHAKDYPEAHFMLYSPAHLGFYLYLPTYIKNMLSERL